MTVRCDNRDALAAARPYLIIAAVAIIGAGVLAAAIAHAPTQPGVWLVAYLVLVCGVAQAALGATQAWLPARTPSTRFCAVQFALFNAGNIGVMAGTLCASWLTVLVGTLLFAAALAMFLYSSRSLGGGWPARVYQLLLAALLIGALTGLILSAMRHLR